MTPKHIQAHALSLFEKARYRECLEYVQSLTPAEKEVPIRILEAVSLIETGSLDDAEVCLRDLRIIVPDSAEICIYLGRILKERGDDEARAVFSEAVRLDPDNKDGLKWYAELLLSQDDYSAAIPVLIRLYTLSDDPGVLCRLMEAYTLNGRPEEAIQSFLSNGAPVSCRIPYLRALSVSGKNEEILSIINPRKNPPDEEFVILIRSLTHVSPSKADEIILPRISNSCSLPLFIAYISLLQVQNRHKEAVGVWSTYLSKDPDPKIRTIICSSFSVLGELRRAEEIYSNVLFPDPPALSIAEILDLLQKYDEIIRLQSGNVHELIKKAGDIMHPSYLAFAGQCAEREGMDDLARLYYQKAFRSDIVHGGLFYGEYLQRMGNYREWEKIFTYILKSTVKVKDLEYVTNTGFSYITTHISQLRFLYEKFLKLLPLLSSKGKSLFCQTAGLLAAEELKKGQYGEGMALCLDALTEVPPHEIRLAEHLFSVLMACKTPGLPVRRLTIKKVSEPVSPVRCFIIPGLTPTEDGLLQYIRRHRVCSELELRQVCGTCRVAGLMNRLIRKTSSAGWQILIKEGITESGEIYRYAGP